MRGSSAGDLVDVSEVLVIVAVVSDGGIFRLHDRYDALYAANGIYGFGAYEWLEVPSSDGSLTTWLASRDVVRYEVRADG